MISVCNIFVAHPPRDFKRFWNLTLAALGTTSGIYIRFLSYMEQIRNGWIYRLHKRLSVGFKWWTVSCGSVLDTSSPVITLTDWTSWFAACRNVWTSLSMQYAVSVGIRQRFWDCQSTVPITCCVAEVSYVAPTDRDRKTFCRKWRAAFHFREIN